MRVIVGFQQLNRTETMDVTALLYANRVRNEAGKVAYALHPPGAEPSDEFSKAFDAAVEQVVKADAEVAEKIRKILCE